MRCPRCHLLGYESSRPCPNCHYRDASGRSIELNRIDWLIVEIDSWDMISRRSQDSIRRRYVSRKKALEVELGLRLPPFTPEEAQRAWPTLAHHELLLQQLAAWLEGGKLKPAASQATVSQIRQRVDELTERLEGYQRPRTGTAETERLRLTNFLLEQVEQLEQAGGFINLEAVEQIRTPLLADQQELEIKLGLRPPPEPVAIEAGQALEPDIARSVVDEVEDSLPAADDPAHDDKIVQRTLDKVPDPNREHVTQGQVPPVRSTPAPVEPTGPRVPLRERVWRALLSERTLQAMLFLGIFLLFAAALSFVAWGWQDFSAPLRVAIPTGFTGLFFALGWYVRKKTPMYRSGIALSAIAALLIPIDFYTVYVNFDVPSQAWPLFWFLTSVTCLVAYIIGALVIRNQFFGYLVGAAAGSAVLALIEIGDQIFDLSLDWRSTGLSVLALGLIMLATLLTSRAGSGEKQGPGRIFASPFRYLSVLGITVIMLITLGWRYLWRDSYDSFHDALTVNWWIGSFIFGWGAVWYRSRGLGLMAAVSLPVAVYLAQAAMFDQLGINPAWHAFGWALLVLFYFLIGFKLADSGEDTVTRWHGRTALIWGVVLLVLALIWPLTDLTHGAAAASSHAVLAGAAIGAALLWRRPIFLYGASALSFSATSFALTEFDLTLAEFSVGWATLAIAHLVLAVSVGTRFPAPVPNFARPLVVCGYLISALAIVPTVLPFDGQLLGYALANWLALAAWGARLAYIRQPGFVGRTKWSKSIFHWFTALIVPVWVWVLFNNVRPLDSALPLTLAAVAWGMVALSYRLTKIEAVYRWPWYLTGLLVSVTAIGTALTSVNDGLAPGLTLLAVGSLYFVDAIRSRQSVELAPAGLTVAWGYILLLAQLQFPAGAIGFCLGLLIAAYFLVGRWAERRSSKVLPQQFYLPLYITSHCLTLALVIQIYVPAAGQMLLYEPWSDQLRLWGAASQVLLAGVYGLYAWRLNREIWAHLAAWFLAGASFCLIISFSTKDGSAVAEMAGVALAFVLAERALFRLGRRKHDNHRQPTLTRFTWQLFQRPLLLTGWCLSAAVMGLSLLYSLIILEAGRAERLWAATALLLILALYALSARMFRQVRFVWFAAALSFAPWTILASLGWFFADQSTPAVYVFSWAVLAWILFSSHLILRRLELEAYALAPGVIAQLLTALAVGWSVFYFTPNSLGQALGLLAIGWLYFAGAMINRHRLEFAPGALITGWGYLVLLNWLNISFDGLAFALALLVATYLLSGIWLERRKPQFFTQRFLAPLFISAHVLTLGVLWQIYVRPFDALFLGADWTNSMRWWGAAAQLVLATSYGFYAWGTYKERWGYLASWLFAMSGAFVAISLSTGQGSSAAKAALGAAVFVLLERGLARLGRSHGLDHRRRRLVRRIWWLYRRPLLTAGWVISALAIWLALVRNLWLLGGNQPRQVWSVVALSLLVGLYALSARLFRKPYLVWLAAPLGFLPWTILTNLGWLTPYGPTLPGYALSWVVLAWLLLLLSLGLERRVPSVYTLPLRSVAHILIPLSLVWGLGDVATSRFTLGLAAGFYGLVAVLDHRRYDPGRRTRINLWQTKFFYPALGLVPAWGMYLLAWLLPAAQRSDYSILVLILAPLGLVAGRWLYRLAPRPDIAQSYAWPGYLAGYGWLFVGSVLAAQDPTLLAMALFYDALLMLASAWLFKRPAWVFVAAILMPPALLLALPNLDIPANRFGWWIMGLGSIYLASSWVLRRANLSRYGTPLLITGFCLIALGLPPSSLDQMGALWGYGAAAVIFAVSAFWLRQPLLLIAASGLVVVPYALSLQLSPLPAAYYGLALFPGAILALAGGWWLDHYYGAWKDFPWADRRQWFGAIVGRLVGWWALPLYTLGLGLASAGPLLSEAESGLIALSLLFLTASYGWAVIRFRLRGWLGLAVVAAHLALLFLFGALGWWQSFDLAQVWVRFLPVTLFMVVVTLFMAAYREEGSPFSPGVKFRGWSHLLYIIFATDVIVGQLISLAGSSSLAAVVITLSHVVLVAGLASFWLSREMIYVSVGLGIVAVTQAVLTFNASLPQLVILLAILAAGYGLASYVLLATRKLLNLGQGRQARISIWIRPLEQMGLGLSIGTLVLMALLGFEVLAWTTQAVVGVRFRHLVDLSTVRMVATTLGAIGLLYCATALVHQRHRLGYAAGGMILTAWIVHAFYILELAEFRQLQWYVLPVGLYLLGLAYMEWQLGHKNIGRRLDYLAIILLFGTLFWQTMLFGWTFAVLLGAEGLATFFWGSGRRLRRFLYTGMVGVILATVGQLLNSLRSINQWIVFGIIGLLLVMAAIAVERKLEDIKSWREVLDTWE